MAKVFLDPGDEYRIVNDNVTIYGSTGDEQIIVESDADNLVIGQNVERVDFAGDVSDFTFKQAGNQLLVYDSEGKEVAKVGVQEDGTELAFTNGLVELTLDHDTHAMLLGGAEVSPDEAAPVEPTEIDDTQTSEAETGGGTGGGTGGETGEYTITADTTSVEEGNAVTFTVTVSEAPESDLTLNYKIDGVSADAYNAADPVGDLGKMTGQVTIPAGETQATFSLTPKNDGVVEGFEGFKVTLLDSSFNTVASSDNVVITDSAQSGANGEVYVLTKEMDNLTGTDNDDAFYGIVAGNISDSTLQPFDTIDGGNGTDKLNVTLSGDDYDGDATINNIEIIEAKASGAARTFNADGLEGLQELTDYKSSQDLYFTNVESPNTEIKAYKISGQNDNNNGNNTLNEVITGSLTEDTNLYAQFKGSALTGTDDTATLKLEGVTANNFDVLINSTTEDGIENLKIISSGDTANKLDSIDVENNTAGTETVKKLIIEGDADLTINNAIDFAGTTTNDKAEVDASAFKGDLTINVDDPNDNLQLKVTGGSGDDVIKMGDSLDTNDSIDGGDGDDTVWTTGTNSLTLKDYNFSNVEVIKAQAQDNSNLTIDADGMEGLKKVVVIEEDDSAGGATSDDDKDITINNLAAGVAVEILNTQANDDSGNDAIGRVELSLKDASGTEDSLDVIVKGVKGGTDTDDDDNKITDLSISNIETLNITSSYTNAAAENVKSTDKFDADDKNTISDISADTKLTKITVDGDSAIDITLGSEMTNLSEFDASNLTANLTVDASGLDSKTTFKGGSANDTFKMEDKLNNEDTIDGGANVNDANGNPGEDVVTATITGLDATTGKLNISNVERLNFTNNGTAVIDASNITGAKSISIDATSDDTTIKNLAAGVNVGLGFKGQTNTGTDLGTITVSLADASGDNDSITFEAWKVASATLKADDIETANILFDNDNAITQATTTLTVSDLKVNTIEVSGAKSDTATTLALGTLAKTTTKVDATEFYGTVTAQAANGVATTFDLRGGKDHDVTGSTANDTFNISTNGSTGVQYDVDGGDGKDTLNVTLGSGTLTDTKVENFETINYTVDPSSNAQVLAISNKGINDDAKTVTVNGGNSLSTFKMGYASSGTGVAIGNDGTEATNLTTFDASNFEGSIDVKFAADVVDDNLTVKGGKGSDDKVTATYTADQTLHVSGVETLNIDNTGAAGAVELDMSDVTGLKTLQAKLAANEDVTVNKLADGVTVKADLANAKTLDVELANKSASDNSLTFEITNHLVDGAKLKTTDVETVTIKNTVNTTSALDLSDLSMTDSGKTMTLNVTGDKALTISALNADVTTLDASGNTGGLIMNGRSATDAMTITGTKADDTIIMKNADDKLDAGDGNDTLKVVYNAVLGGIKVDLSADGDQITTFNGSANSAVQTGFKNVDLSGYTGGNGADITAHKDGSTIIGTGANDQITGGAGDDQITGGAGADQITGGGGQDKIVITHATAVDTISDFTLGASGDTLQFDLIDLEGTSHGLNSSATDFVNLKDATTSISQNCTITLVTDESEDTAVANSTGDVAQIIVLKDNTGYANADAAVDAFEVNGNYTLQGISNVGQNDAFLFVYKNSTDNCFYVAAAVATAGSPLDGTDTDAFANGALDGVDLVKLSGVTSWDGLNTANFDFIA